METTIMFALGMLTAIIISVGVGIVWAVRKITLLEKKVEKNWHEQFHDRKDTVHSILELKQDLQNLVDALRRDLEREVSDIYDGLADQSGLIEEQVEKIYSAMDSRFDKLETKLTQKQKQVLNG